MVYNVYLPSELQDEVAVLRSCRFGVRRTWFPSGGTLYSSGFAQNSKNKQHSMAVMSRSYGYGIYIYPLNFKMRVECYEGMPSVKLVDGPSPLEGLVVFKPDRYVCYNGFTPRAAELVCRELGFPAAEEYSAQALLTSAKKNSIQRLSCQEGSSFQSLKDCPLETTECFPIQTVRLRCQSSQVICEHLGHVYHGYWDSSVTDFGSRLTLTCVEGYVINGSATLQCVGLPGWSTYFPVWNASVPSCVRDGHQTTFIGYILGVLLGVIVALIVLTIAWFNYQQKRRLRRPDVPNQSNDHTNDGQLQYRRETERGVSLNPASNDTGTVSGPLTDHPGSKLGSSSTHQDNQYHMYHDIAEADKMSCHHAGIETTSLTHEYLSLQETPPDQNDCYREHEYSTRILK
ncbi:uncharacterized protein [Diadema setosum]|uniref:uncharacterized protein n=1 Tax=Diadema setosum TaxID=31175 RepID=UPI003B3B26EA